MNTENKSDTKKGRRSHSDLWYITMLLASALIFLVEIIILAVKLRPSSILVPVKLTYGGSFVQGSWWIPWLLPLSSLLFFGLTAVFINRTSAISKLYRNGAMVTFLGVQMVSAAVAYRLAELSLAR